MGLRIFPVVGEALNFGGRRMATIMRIAWLPVTLLLTVNMAAVFAYLTVILGRVITFADAGTYVSAQQALLRYWVRGWNQHFEAMAAIAAGHLALNFILIASFMAPLIRLSGLGEKPAPGIVRLAFGPDQIRYLVAQIFSILFVAALVLAPVLTASFYALKYILEAMSQTMASFPDPESLHTIELVTRGDSLVAGGMGWFFNLAVPLALVAPFGLILWAAAFLHFHPRNRPYAPEGGGPIARAFIALVSVGFLARGAFYLVREEIINWAKSASSLGGDFVPDFSDVSQNAILFFGVAAYLLVTYVNLRLFAYPGVAVCRKSLGFGDMLRVSRGWNLIRLQIILIVIGVFMYLVQTYVLNYGLFQNILPNVINRLLALTIITTRLVNSGVTAEWVQPVFVWTWNGIRILANIFWLFFTYGVTAGLYGRLYRESEQEEEVARRPRVKAVWERGA